MTKKMTTKCTGKTDMSGFTGKKAAVSDFDSSLLLQPVGNTGGALTLRTIFPQYKDPISIQKEIQHLRSCPLSFIPGHHPAGRSFWTSAVETGVYGSFMIPISNMCLILIPMLQSSHV